MMHLVGSFLLLQLTHHALSAPPTDPNTYTLSNCTQEDLRHFEDQTTARILTAETCFMPELENAIFIRFGELTTLNITDSKLTRLEDYALNGLKQLRMLSLARNNITQVKSWSSEPMRSLLTLDLRRNAIRKLTLKSFHRYPNLQRLNLAQNLLDDIDDGIFRWMPYLKFLNLGRNLLKTIDARNFHGMHRLTHLSLYYNDINEIEWVSFQTNTHLRSLRLEGNELNNLEFMTVMNLVRLVHLNLSHNAIESLDSLAFSKDYELRDLDLSHNRLTEVLTDTFAGLESLQSLNISHNRIHDIELRSFHELISLERIDLSSNNLTHLPAELFNGSADLQHINLSTNALQDIDPLVFAGLSKLRVVDLSANELQSDSFLENFAHELERSELKLNLSRNRFTVLNISALMELASVELAGNQWNCKWLIQEMLRSPASIHFGRNYSVVTSWSSALLDISGIDCYDEQSKRSIVVLDTGRTADRNTMCETTAESPQQLPPPLIWPRISLDKFDSRSVIIWLLIAIAVIFSAMRVVRKFIEKSKRKKLFQQLRDKKFNDKAGLEELKNLRQNDMQINDIDSVDAVKKESHVKDCNVEIK